MSESYPSGSTVEIASRALPNSKSKLKRPSTALNSTNNKRLRTGETMSNGESINSAALTHESRDEDLNSEPLTQEMVVEGGMESDMTRMRRGIGAGLPRKKPGRKPKVAAYGRSPNATTEAMTVPLRKKRGRKPKAQSEGRPNATKPSNVLSIQGDERSYPPITTRRVELFDGMRMPAVIAQLPPAKRLDIPDDHLEEFSFKFLKSTLGGVRYHSEFYIKNKKQIGASEPGFSHISCYVLLERAHEPLLPRHPGEHGAKISPYLYSVDDDRLVDETFRNIPMFIRQGEEGYKYYGTYCSPQYSDRLEANVMRTELPHHVKVHWAKKLGVANKPRWAILAIKAAWPKTPVGWIENNVTKTIIEYSEELHYDLGEPLRAEISDDEARAVTVEQIMQAFENPDMDLFQPVMRFYYEYYQCDGYDRRFYEALVKKKHDLISQGAYETETM